MNPVNEPATMTGTYGHRDCNAGNGHLGCGVTLEDDTFGGSFNLRGGGIYAMEWADSHISIWFWPRGSAPSSALSSSEPAPETWGKPAAYFALGGECLASHFSNHKLILNTTLCGDWAGNTFDGGEGAKGMAACESHVAKNPTAFRNAYWDIASIRTYQRTP